MRQYPFLRYSVKRGEWGNAGCTYSHIQLLEQLQKRGGGDGRQYYMVFEDDARLSPELIDSGLVEAPPDADVVLLSPTSTKTVRIPYKYGEDGYAIRVTQSWGSMAYVVTSLGAGKLLRHLRGTGHDDPIDVAMHRAKGMRMYQPTNGWPKAHHGVFKSTRRAANSKAGL
jgi:GR25 family glycosyltransferase involved in LPS biosynthesis